MDKSKISEAIYSEDEIKAMVTRLAAKIQHDYAGQEVVIIGVLKGSVIFVSDLIRALDLDILLDFIVVSSYQGTKSTGVVQIIKDTDIEISGKHLILVEDIVDTGLTLAYLRELFLARKPASLAICSAFDKPSRRKVDVPINYIGLEVPNVCVVGYGLDYNQKFRNLPYLAAYEI